MIHLQETLNNSLNKKNMLESDRPREKMLTKGVKSLSDAELLKALEVLEPIFMSKDAKSKIFNVSSQKKNLSYQFAVAALREAKNRNATNAN